MSTMNIAGLTAVEDPSYRYKMPRVMGKIEGRGNGIKTVLLNVTDVAASLNRDAPEITKFFGCELGSQTTYAMDTDRAIVNGQHRDQDLQTHLSRYIENFVLCKNCRLPETHYKIKDGMISQKCLACGHKECVDMTHKLTAFILAQHKKNKDASKGDKKDKKKDKAEKGEKAEKTEKTDKEKAEKKEKKKDKADREAEEGSGEKAEKKKEKSKKKVSKGADEVGENVFGISADADDDEEESDSKAAGKNCLGACTYFLLRVFSVSKPQEFQI
jgi:translation initiation factor 5